MFLRLNRVAAARQNPDEREQAGPIVTFMEAAMLKKVTAQGSPAQP